MEKEVVTFGSLALVTIGLVIMAISTIISASLHNETWLSETIRIPAGTHKVHSRSFPTGSIVWLWVQPGVEGMSLFVMNEVNYHSWKAGRSATYVKEYEYDVRDLFIPPSDETLYFVFVNGLTYDYSFSVEILRFWHEYEPLHPSEVAYIGISLLTFGLVLGGYGVVAKPKAAPVQGALGALYPEKFVKIAIVVGLMVLLLAAPLSWVSLSRLWWNIPSYGYISHDWHSWSLVTYLTNLPTTLEGLKVIYYVQGYVDIALSIVITLVAYILAFLCGIIALLYPKRFKKELFLGALASGALCVLSGVSWIYAIEAAKTRPIWGPWMDIVKIGAGSYIAIVAGAIILFSCYLYRGYKPRNERSVKQHS